MNRKCNNELLLDQVNTKFDYLVESISKLNEMHDRLSMQVDELGKPQFNGKEVMTVIEACCFLGLTKGYLYKLIQTDSIPYHKPMGKCVFFIREELISWVRECNR